MRIVSLAENTKGKSNCPTEHGLSLYIETEKHKLLLDTGSSDLFFQNAKRLGVDLKKVDTVILSHGHYDHGGGLSAFLQINSKAKIYVQKSVFGDYYSEHDDGLRYIGLNKELRLYSQIVELSGDYKIDDELSVFSTYKMEYPIPSTNKTLKKKIADVMEQDDFGHEQCLVVSQGNIRILLSGCAHHGIVNIMESYNQKYGNYPDIAISGFHLMRKNVYSRQDVKEIIATADKLKEYPTRFYTCHCTGEKPYETMKAIMGDKLSYIHCGDDICLLKKRKKKISGENKFLIGTAAFCLALAAISKKGS